MYYYPIIEKATKPSNLTGAKVLGHTWCGFCKSMKASEEPDKCSKCGRVTEWKPPLERTA